MKKYISIITILFTTILISCNSESKVDTSKLIERNVRKYFFLEDTLALEIKIIDTLKAANVEEMLAQVNENLFSVNEDLDTLSLMIDDVAYNRLNFEKELEGANIFNKSNYKDSINLAEKTILQYKLTQALIRERKTAYNQTNRLLLNLKRSIWADVAGFNITVSYRAGEQMIDLELLLDAEYNIVD